MYVKYCQNKPVSEHILAEHLDYFKDIQMKLKHRLGVSLSTVKFYENLLMYSLNYAVSAVM